MRARHAPHQPLLRLPEIWFLFFSLLLHFAWEMLQAPWFEGLAEQPHWIAVVECSWATVGDGLIALLAFWIAALVGSSRQWFDHRNPAAWVTYLGVGLLATVVLERLNTEVWQRWAYAPAMPQLPVLGTGLAPLLQWLLLPPLAAVLARGQLRGRRLAGTRTAGSRAFVPALRFHALTGAYDFAVERFFHDRARKRRLAEQAAPQAAELVLDIGGGTGTLGLELHRQCPDCKVLVADVDLAMLAKARQKLAPGQSSIALLLANADALPLADSAIDRALASLVFHHLEPEVKRAALAELYRVIRPGGELHLLDFGPPSSLSNLILSLPGRLFDGWSNTADNFRGRLPGLIAAAGFSFPEELRRERTLFGQLFYHRSRRSRGE